MVEPLSRTKQAIGGVALDLNGEFEAAKSDIAHRLKEQVEPPASEDGSAVAGEAMEAYLLNVGRVLESVLRDEAGVFAPGAWLWYLRNSPPELVAGGSKVSFLQVMRIAEAASTLSNARKDPQNAGWVELPYEVSEAEMRTVARFSAISHLLLYVHQRIRLNRRGATWKLDGPWPVKSMTSEIATAVSRFDKRNAESESLYFNRSGTVLAVPFDGEVHEAPIETAVSVLPVAEPGIAEVRFGRSRIDEPIYSTHAVQPLVLDRLRDFNKQIGEPWWRSSAPALVTLLVAVCPLLRQETDLIRELQSSGLWLMRRNDFVAKLKPIVGPASEIARSILLGAETPASPDELMDALAATQGRLWPAEAHQVMRPEKDWVLVDLAAASRGLDAAFEFAGRPETSERDKHFEKAIQWAISGTSWKPEGEVARIPGRHLKIDGETVAEVDAVAAKGGVLVLVDGRGTAYTHDFETGDRNAVLTATGQLEEKVSKMTKRIQMLRARPKGDNYDLSGFELILGTVVTAVPIYTSRPDSFAEEMDLPAVVSLQELVSWLQSR